MIHIIIGTKAQLIKMAPVMCELKQQNIAYNFIYTGQHKETVSDILNNFDIEPPDFTLYYGDDITSIPKMFFWGLENLYKAFIHKNKIFKSDNKGIVLVHGDTFSTLLGALMGKFAGLKVGHVESGLRSKNLFHPFPEEITRLLVFNLSDYLYCPGEWAMINLAKYKGYKINTQRNTLSDAFRMALPKLNDNDRVVLPQITYAVVSLHRYENIFSKSVFLKVMNIVEKISKKYYLIFILHKPTEINLKKFGLYEQLERNPNIEFRPRYDYFNFIKLVMHAKFVVSDGGSNQEECFYLGKPILLLRKATERQEGLNKNCVLSQYSEDIIEEFISNIEKYSYSLEPVKISPSEIIVEQCRKFV